ncbi:MAG: LptF/LptG family permease, partial [Planctomycetota bacterium]
MSLLDRYIAKQFFTNVVLLFVVLFGFVITIDVSLNIDRFVERATDLASSGTAEPGAMRVSVLTAFLVADLWWPRILQLFNFMLGLVLVGAMGFTCAQLVRHREIVAALAGGMSLRRLGRPIIIVALAMSALQVINQELFIPRIAPLLTRDQGDAGEHRLGTTRVPLAADSLGRVWYATSLDAENNVLTDLSIWERASDGQPARRIRADAAVWRDGAWALTGGRAESRLATGPLVEPMERLETDLDPTELRMRRFAGYSQSLSWRQLGELVRNLDRLDADTDQAEAARRRY